MPRLAYLVELDANNITYLAWAAGMATGAGNAQAAEALNDIVNRIEAYEIPDEEVAQDYEYDAGDEVSVLDEEPEAEVIELPVDETPEERDVDPNFPGPGVFTPPPPINNPTDFGAGPPPRH